MRISVCIPSVRSTTLERAVAAVRRQGFQDWELVVVGQGDGTALCEATARGARGDRRVRYLHADRPGLCAARNAGMAATYGEIVAFVDDDCEPRQDWLATLDACLTADVGLVCGAVIAPAKARRGFAVCPQIVPDSVLFDPATSPRPPGFGLLGANFAVRRSAAERVGLFDECLGAGARFGGGEEYDYVDRLALLGVRMRSSPEPVVDHSYGYRYGARAVLSHKSQRARGNGALAAKRMMVRAQPAQPPIWRSVRRELGEQLRTMTLWRAVPKSYRLFHYMTGFTECLMSYELCEGGDPGGALLRPTGTRRWM